MTGRRLSNQPLRTLGSPSCALRCTAPLVGKLAQLEARVLEHEVLSLHERRRLARSDKPGLHDVVVQVGPPRTCALRVVDLLATRLLHTTRLLHVYLELHAPCRCAGTAVRSCCEHCLRQRPSPCCAEPVVSIQPARFCSSDPLATRLLRLLACLRPAATSWTPCSCTASWSCADTACDSGLPCGLLPCSSE
jgi:hypothetical protein